MAKPLALTLGEPAGIGPDITIKAWLRRNELKLPPFYLLGDRDALANRAKTLGLKIELADISGAAGRTPVALSQTFSPPRRSLTRKTVAGASRRRRAGKACV